MKWNFRYPSPRCGNPSQEDLVVAGVQDINLTVRQNMNPRSPANMHMMSLVSSYRRIICSICSPDDSQCSHRIGSQIRLYVARSTYLVFTSTATTYLYNSETDSEQGLKCAPAFKGHHNPVLQNLPPTLRNTACHSTLRLSPKHPQAYISVLLHLTPSFNNISDSPITHKRSITPDGSPTPLTSEKPPTVAPPNPKFPSTICPSISFHSQKPGLSFC
jgi:hypothetical protein